MSAHARFDTGRFHFVSVTCPTAQSISAGYRANILLNYSSVPTMTPRCSIRLLPALALGARLLSAEAPSVAGTWRGESVCVTDTSACHNESVVYYIKDVPDQPDLVLIQADKIVAGKAITMGTGQWQHDRAQRTLEWRTGQQVWLLKIAGNRMDGTLTLADQTVFRKMTLEKEK
jgi:hypothetical protein